MVWGNDQHVYNVNELYPGGIMSLLFDFPCGSNTLHIFTSILFYQYGEFLVKVLSVEMKS